MAIPFDVAKQMTAHQIVSLVEWHHTTLHAIRADNHPTVLTPMLIKSHRERTAKVDAPLAAKMRRIAKRKAPTQPDAVAANLDLERRSAKPKRKMQSRGFQGSRGFDGTVRWKKDRKSHSRGEK